MPQYQTSYDPASQVCMPPELDEEELMCVQPEGNAAAADQLAAAKKDEPLLDMFDVTDGVLVPLEFLAEHASTLGGLPKDAVAAGMANQAAGALGVLGGVIGITEGVSGMYKAATDEKDDNFADVLPSVGHLAAGGLSTAGGIGALAGMEGLAAMGPLGAAVAVGGFLGKHAGNYAWELDKKYVSGGSKTEELEDSYVQPEDKALFNLLEGNFDKVLDSEHLF